LQDNETENLGDARVDEFNPDDNYATDYYMGVNNFYGLDSAHSYIIFNTSSISGASPTSIDEVIFCVYHFSDGMDGGDDVNISAYNVYTYPWVNISSGSSELIESTITYNNQPCGINFTNSTFCNLTAYDTHLYIMDDFGWKCYNVTGSLNISDDYVSYVLKSDTISGEDDTVWFYTREHDNVSLRPYLNITYTLSESAEKGTVIWTQVGGNEDPDSPHILEMVEDITRKGSPLSQSYTRSI